MRKFIMAILTIALVTIGLGPVAPAMAQTDDVQSPTGVPPEAEVWSTVKIVGEVYAKAKAAVYNDFEVTAGMLLEEERTATPHKVIRELVPPTKAEALKWGTRVDGNKNGKRVMADQVKAYDAKLTKAKKRVTKLKLRLEYADSDQERRELRQKLRAAKRFLREVKTSWKHKPLLLFSGCARNTGRLNRMDLKSFVSCAGNDFPKSDKEWLAIGWVPELRATLAVGAMFKDGHYEDWCLNFYFFDIPQGTPDESMYLIVRNATKIFLAVRVGYEFGYEMVLGGKLTCPDGTVVEDEKVKTGTWVDEVIKTVPGHWDVTEILRFGEEEVKADLTLKDEVKASVRTAFEEELSQRLVLECPNQAPTGEIVQAPEHMYPGGYYRVKVVGSDPEDGANVTLNVTVSGAAEVVNDPNYPVHEDIEGTNRVRYFWIKAGSTPGNATITLNVTDQDGNTLKEPITKTFPVVADVFRSSDRSHKSQERMMHNL